ncbi:glucose PTS transporter subunit IIA [Enterococcus gilvus]|uniref:glucose PTS transporter subunit IIA n=1 Tax=Enterococcus gilvus TaxID=160453 RepID=UPI0028D25212|nr:glucose PTS transporter subunit IIA [Enterococcus gilvus]
MMVDEMQLGKMIEEIGGEENIQKFYHCITRMRFLVKSKEKVNLKELSELPAVRAAKFQGEELQLVIGADVEKYYQALSKRVHSEENEGAIEKSDKPLSVKGILNGLMDVLSGVFVPILPAITGACMVKSLLALLGAFSLISPESRIYQILNLMADCAFYFLPFFLAVTSARKFHVNEFLGLMIAGSLMYPTIIDGATEGLKGLNFIGINIPLVNYSSSVIPVVLGVFLLSVVYKILDRFIPKSFSLLVTSTLSILITVPIILAFIAPLGYYGGNLLADFIAWIFSLSAPIAGLVLGATVPLIIMTGMHYAVNPIVLQNLSKLGYDFVAPMFFISNISQAGATFGVGMKTQDKNQRRLAISTGISALFGITEPAMYGVNLLEKTPFKVSLVASGIGSCFVSLLGVKVYSFVMPGITGLPAYIDNKLNVYTILIGIILTFTLSFLGTMIFWKSSKPVEKKVVEESGKDIEINMIVPFDGEIVPLGDVPDEIFSEKIMGDGFAMIPTSNEIFAPISGTVMVVSDTKHAIGIRGSDGNEILIHLGIDTVKLNGSGFDILVKQGQKITQGEKIASVDWSLIEDKKLSIITPIVFTNTKKSIQNLLEGKLNKHHQAKESL